MSRPRDRKLPTRPLGKRIPACSTRLSLPVGAVAGRSLIAGEQSIGGLAARYPFSGKDGMSRQRGGRVEVTGAPCRTTYVERARVTAARPVHSKHEGPTGDPRYAMGRAERCPRVEFDVRSDDTMTIVWPAWFRSSTFERIRGEFSAQRCRVPVGTHAWRRQGVFSPGGRAWRCATQVAMAVHHGEEGAVIGLMLMGVRRAGWGSGRVGLHHSAHVGHATATARVLLRDFGDDRLGGEDVLGDRRGVLQRGARDHRGVDDAGGDEVDDLAGHGV